MKKFPKIHNGFKSFIFEIYWLLTLFAVAAVIVCFSFIEKNPQNIALCLTVLGSVFSFFFFIQKQKLEELTLFKTLFTEFNKRYDRMNKRLNKIVVDAQERELSLDDKSLLDDYFNLCAEEYLFYEKGYIYNEVWKSWENGMKYYLKEDERIYNYWKEQKVTESYYKLNLELTEEEAKKPPLQLTDET